VPHHPPGQKGNDNLRKGFLGTIESVPGKRERKEPTKATKHPRKYPGSRIKNVRIGAERRDNVAGAIRKRGTGRVRAQYPGKKEERKWRKITGKGALNRWTGEGGERKCAL